MGLSDRLKDLRTKAGEAAAEHNEKLHDAVDKAGAAADRHTGGRYSEHIEKAGAKADDLIDRAASEASGDRPAS